MEGQKTIRLIINSMVGIGGSVRLKGTDSEFIRQKTILLKAVPRAEEPV